MMVPQALKRPFLSCVAPRKTAAKAGSRYELPAVGAPDPMFEASTMPVTPARVAEASRQPNWSRSVRTDASRVASLLKPVA